ncbi:MAG: YkgJ family cysteine cluster protein, partial [Planctomycetota bacterium]
AEIDAQAARLERRHAKRLACRAGCHQCCVDGISVFEIEAEHIRRHHEGLLEAGHPHPAGACAILDEQGACRIYKHRPYVCRSQGLPLRWLDHDDAGEPVELRDICPLNDRESEPLEAIPAEDCWSIGPFEMRLVRLQIELGGRPPRRIRLRDLFRTGAKAV